MIRIGREIKEVFPDIVVGYLSGSVRNSENHPDVWNLIKKRSGEIASTMDAESIRQVEGIRLGKNGYRQLGKDPNRYRLSAEALMRRIVKGQELYSINTVVDILNLVSIETGITIGGFDQSLIRGEIELGIGRPGEEFEAIGRGPLNVESLPVYRDEAGVIGSPTSDCMRTRIQTETGSILMLITGFYGPAMVIPVIDRLTSHLSGYCNLQSETSGIII
ncbi:MAG: phenylalanine--tRNA ligase beta subunit-related protein [Bacteroidota bacterium]